MIINKENAESVFVTHPSILQYFTFYMLFLALIVFRCFRILSNSFK